MTWKDVAAVLVWSVIFGLVLGTHWSGALKVIILVPVGWCVLYCIYAAIRGET